VTAARRESPEDKADRYYREHRIAIDCSDWTIGFASAYVQGSKPTAYHVMHTRALGWRCDCRASVRCAHILAVAAVFSDPAPAAERAASAERGRAAFARIGAPE
jgi:hypothetical protein